MTPTMPPSDDPLTVLTPHEQALLGTLRISDAPTMMFAVGMIDRLAAKLKAADGLAGAAKELVDDETECRYDHNDFCQSHYSSRPCREEVMREALAAFESLK